VTIDVNNLKDLNIAQYAYLRLLQDQHESALSTSGISDADLQDLKNKGYLSQHAQITNKFTTTFNTLTSLFLETPKADSQTDNFVETYRGIFPAGNNSSGFPYKGDKQGCTKKMRKFLREYPEYTKDIILKATRDYVTDHFFKGYAYMQTAAYFIEKNGISNLAALCEVVKGKSNTTQRASENRGFEEDLN
jgi:hypothetical protein